MLSSGALTCTHSSESVYRFFFLFDLLKLLGKLTWEDLCLYCSETSWSSCQSRSASAPAYPRNQHPGGDGTYLGRHTLAACHELVMTEFCMERWSWLHPPVPLFPMIQLYQHTLDCRNHLQWTLGCHHPSWSSLLYYSTSQAVPGQSNT